MITPKIFRAYDIRGIYEQDFDLQGAEDIGKGYGTYLLRTSSNHERPLRVCVGRDGRTHGPQVHEAFIRGLETTGIQIVNVGMCFSPLLFFSICAGRFDGGVNITASHNPKEYNGFKMQRENAQAICGDEIQEILKIIEERDFIQVSDEDELDVQEDNFWAAYIEKVSSISKDQRKAKVVVDAGNGVAGAFAPRLLRHLGYDVVELFCEVDGEFPNHPSDPENTENLKDLQAKVLEVGADYGVAFDGDGDRVGLVDNHGEIYDADYLLMLLAKDMLSRNEGAAVVYTVTSTGLVKEEVERLGGVALESKVGHSFVEEKMHESGALIGGESSGHLFFAENYYGFDDGVYGAVKILEILTEAGIPVKGHFEHLPKVFTSPELKFEVLDEKKFELIENISNRLKDEYDSHTIDGIKVFFGEGAWAICRASNTSPKVSIRAEAKDQSKLDEVVAFMGNVMNEELEKLG